MKAERLLAITMLLLNRDCISAPELARRFEVSVRSIYRDIESLCEAGIPIVAYPGAGGGYGIMGEFKIDRSIVKPGEIDQITAALGSISAAVGDARINQTIDRLKALRAGSRSRPAASGLGPENYLFIELAPASRVREKIRDLRRAIEERRVLGFDYVDSEGARSSRRVEPAALVFTWQSWYLYAFCRKRDAFRLFKISRVAALELGGERFVPRPVDLDSRPWNQAWAESSPFCPALVRFFDPARIAEHYPEEAISVEGDSALVRTELPMDDWAVSFLLGLGIPFEVIEPEGLRLLVAERASDLLRRNS